MYGDRNEVAVFRRKQAKLAAMIILVVFVWVFIGWALYHTYQKYGISSEERFERELRQNRVAALALEPVKRHFPYEYSRMRQATALEYNLDKHGSVLKHIPADFLTNFLKRHSYEAISGGDRETLAFIAALGDLSDRAITDKALCHMLKGNEDQMSDMALVFSQEPFARMFAAFVEVAASGRKNQTPRKRAQTDDSGALRIAYQKLGPSKPKEPFGPLDESGKCRNEALMVRAIRSLPEDQQLRVAAVLFQAWR